jgi:hypothetical protein
MNNITNICDLKSGTGSITFFQLFMWFDCESIGMIKGLRQLGLSRRSTVLALCILFTSLGTSFWIGRITGTTYGAGPRYGALVFRGRLAGRDALGTEVGRFKFEIINPAESRPVWSSAPSTVPGNSADSVEVTVQDGTFEVALGDTNIQQMPPLPFEVFESAKSGFDRSKLELRVWYGHGDEQLVRMAPDQRLGAVQFRAMALLSSPITFSGRQSGVSEPTGFNNETTNHGNRDIQAGLAKDLAKAIGPPIRSRTTTRAGTATEIALLVPPRKQLVGAPSGDWQVTRNSSFVLMTGRSRHQATADADDLVLVYSTLNCRDGPEHESQGFELSASLETNGAIIPVRFAGHRLARFMWGDTLVSEPVPVHLSAGEVFWIRTGLNGLASDTSSLFEGELGQLAARQGGIPANYQARGFSYRTGDGFVGSSVDDIGTYPFIQSSWAVDGGFIPPGDGPIFVPQCILGTAKESNARSIQVLLDEVLSGDGYLEGSNPAADSGFARRSFNSSFAVNQVIASEQSVAEWVAPRHPQCLQMQYSLLPMAGKLLISLGGYDILHGTNLIRLKADLIALWLSQANFGVKVWATTILPRTTSSDGFTSTGGQTPVPEGDYGPRMIALNSWLRAGAPMTNGFAASESDPRAIRAGDGVHPLTGILDLAAVVESTPGSGVWKSGNILSSGVCTSASITNLVDVAASFGKGADGSLGAYVGLLLWNTSKNLWAQISSNSSTEIKHGAIPGQEAGDSYKIVEALTCDGSHPSSYGHAEISKRARSAIAQ